MLVPGQMYVVKAFRIPSESMVPTLQVHDRVLTARFLLHFRDPQRGEIFVFHPNGEGSTRCTRPRRRPTQNYVKRVVGLPNEVIGSVQGRVYVCSEQPLPRRPEAPERARLHVPRRAVHVRAADAVAGHPGTDLAPTVVPPGYYYMMGDNRTSSADSRAWGPVRRSQLIGRVFVTYWPVGRFAFW